MEVPQTLGGVAAATAGPRHGVDRRGFLGLAAGAAGAAWNAGPAAASTPRRGGVLRQGLLGGSATDSLDPALLATQLTINVNYQLANALVEITPANEAVGELAESWEAADGGRRWVFKLRRGVTFHNGKGMTSADVVYSLNRHRGPDTKSATAAEMRAVEDVRADGPNEVILLLAEPNVDLPYLIADIHLTILPEGAPGDSGIGTGPYVLEVQEPGVRYLARRNPGYFKPDRAWFDAVETLVVNDGAARVTALQAGDVDLINSVEPRAVAPLARNPDLAVARTQGRNFLYFPMRCDTPPFDDPDLRRALKLAVDRQQMVDTVLLGYGSPGNDHPISPAYPLFPEGVPQTIYDPDRARQLFRKSGHQGPIPLRVSDAAFPGATDAALLFQRSAARAGIEIEVRRVPADGYWENVWNKEPFCASTWSGRPTQDLILTSAFKSTSPWNDSRWVRPEFDALLARARAEADPAKRRGLYRDAVTMVRDDAGHVTPMFSDYLDGLSRRVQGFVPDPNFELSGYRAAERCWFAA